MDPGAERSSRAMRRRLDAEPLATPARRSPGAPYSLGFDIGGSRLKSGAVDHAGNVASPMIGETGPRAGAEQLVVALLERARDHLDKRGAAGCQGIGVALPGFVEATFGAHDLPGKLPGLQGFPLRDTLEREFGLPVRCLNDGIAAAVGEWRFGAGAGSDDVVVLTLGTGVGSGVIVNGRPLANRHLGMGTGVGQFTIDTGGRLCLCGNRGCAETLISAVAVANRLRDHLARGVASYLLPAFAHDPGSITFRSLIDGVDQGDRVCLEVMAEFTRDLGATIVTAIHAYSPSVVVLCGGMLEAADRFLPAVQAYVDRHRWVYPPDRPISVVRAQLEPFAGVVGAAVSVFTDMA